VAETASITLASAATTHAFHVMEDRGMQMHRLTLKELEVWKDAFQPPMIEAVLEKSSPEAKEMLEQIVAL